METGAERRTRQPAGAAVLQEDVTQAITSALFDELAEAGYGRLAIEAVAKRAGVGKTAIYRRWPSKQAMVADLVSTTAVTAIEVPDTGDLRGDVHAFLVEADRALRHPLVARIFPDLLAEATRNPELRETLLVGVRDPRRSKVAAMVERAIGRGELPADTDLENALDMLAGPLYWRLCVVRTPTGESYLKRLADQVVAAMAASGGAG